MISVCHNLLGSVRDGSHRLDRLEWKLSGGRLPGKHHRIGQLGDRDVYIRRFGPRWPGLIDHRLQHLRRGDCWLCGLIALIEETLLRLRNPFEGYLDPKITAGDHDAVSFGEDFGNDF
jgi:hypothetical protein